MSPIQTVVLASRRMQAHTHTQTVSLSLRFSTHGHNHRYSLSLSLGTLILFRCSAWRDSGAVFAYLQVRLSSREWGDEMEHNTARRGKRKKTKRTRTGVPDTILGRKSKKTKQTPSQNENGNRKEERGKSTRFGQSTLRRCRPEEKKSLPALK